MLDKLAHEIGMMVIGLAVLIPLLLYVNYRMEQWLQYQLGSKYWLYELAVIALVVGFVLFVLVWVVHHHDPAHGRALPTRGIAEPLPFG